ncbi:MAG: hypothetical protein WC960_07330 [Bacteroidales bacterium]
MKEQVTGQWSLTPLRKEELMEVGGITLRELLELAAILYKVIKTVEEYWAPFKEGFEKGWREG